MYFTIPAKQELPPVERLLINPDHYNGSYHGIATVYFTILGRPLQQIEPCPNAALHPPSEDVHQEPGQNSSAQHLFMNTHAKLSQDAKWLIGVLLALALPLAGGVIKVTTDISSMRSSSERTREEIANLSSAVQDVTSSLNDLIRKDLSVVKERVARIESMQITPGADKRLDRLEEDMRILRKTIDQN